MALNEKVEIEQLKNGSVESFEILYFRYSARLYNFVIKMSGGNSFMSEELVQRTFIKIWENRSQLNPDKSFIAYLCTIAKNMLINEYQHQTLEYIYQKFLVKQLTAAHSNTELEVDRKLLDEYIEKLTELDKIYGRKNLVIENAEGITKRLYERPNGNLAVLTLSKKLSEELEAEKAK